MKNRKKSAWALHLSVTYKKYGKTLPPAELTKKAQETYTQEVKQEYEHQIYLEQLAEEEKLNPNPEKKKVKF